MNTNIHSHSSMHNGHNDSIGCSVTECNHHAKSENFCTLQQINVIKHESEAKTIECTDCGSFDK
jgi:Domain of Unknown Function (DUF1540).